MKKLNRKFVKGTNWALAGLMSLLGFASCGNEPTEYGSPHADYEFLGKVTNEKGEPISNIQVKIAEKYNYDNEPLFHGVDSIQTDTSGEYKIEIKNNLLNSELYLITTDKENGSYQSDTTKIEITQKDYYKKAKDWYRGAARKETDITLKAK
ncbi:MAG: radical SAM-associated putative lipoprotein [Tannerella sp.]|jgi:putative lipoprotein (rSAM/lipoprotein system)|nr:radical SAM-associated putative lipoprotein [Tannerella sp.]